MIDKQAFVLFAEVEGYPQEFDERDNLFIPREVKVTYKPHANGGWVPDSLWVGGHHVRADGIEGKTTRGRYFRWDDDFGVFRDTAAHSRSVPEWAETYALASQPYHKVVVGPSR